MKLVRQVKLFFQEGSSDKVYEIDLCESGDGFLVNFRYGRRGASLKDGTKTVFPVPLAQAEKVFNDLEQEKRKKGYVAAGEAPIVTSTETKTSSSSLEKRKKAILKHLKAAASGEEPEHWPLSRIIWRAGALNIPEAVPIIIRINETSDPTVIHSSVFAIGRCGTNDAVGYLQSIQKNMAIATHTRELVTDALLRLSSPAEKKIMTDGLLATISSSVRDSILANDPVRLDKSLRELLFELKTVSNEYLVNVYRLTRDVASMKSVFLNIIPSITFTRGNFYAIRRIFKTAEMLGDFDTYGVIAKELERQPATYKSQSHITSEKKKQRAYSTNTRKYFINRVSRELRKLGTAGSETYTSFSAGLLLAFQESDAVVPYNIPKFEYTYNELTRRHDSRETRTYYDAFHRFTNFNYILYKNSKRYKNTGNTWICVDPYQPGQKAPYDREEAFPGLWNEAPFYIIQLLTRTTIAPVAEFAVKVWKANASFEKESTTEDIALLLNSRFADIQQIGLDVALRRYDRSNPDYALLLAMLNAPLEAARRQVETWLLGAQREVASNTEFVVSLMKLTRPDAHEWLRKFFAAYSFDAQQAEIIVAKVIAHLVTSTVNTEEEGNRVTLTGDTMIALFRNALGNISLSIVQDLFRHTAAEMHAVAGKILLAHSVRPEELPDDFLKLMLQSQNAGTRSIGISLLGKFPDSLLLERKELLVSLSISQLADVRATVRPITLRIAKSYPQFGAELVDLFVPAVIMKESYEGVHDDIISILTSDELASSLAVIPQDKILKLVNSKFAAPRKLGVVLLKRGVKFSDLTVPQVVKLAGNAVEEVRKLAWDEFRANPAKMKYHVIDALKVTDSNWDDTRAFAYDFFRDNFTAADWTPELLILLCDSVREDVQDFGKELITKFFDPKDGPEYLLKLSQHPSTRVQLFATAYLEQFAKGKLDMIQTLTPYFVTLLSHVNKGRTAKKRVMQFLKSESLRDETIARIGSDIFARVSVSMAISERAEYISALRDIQRKYPSITSPLKVKDHGDYINS